MSVRCKSLWKYSVTLCALGLSVAAFGEQAATQAATPADDQVLEEIVITGTLIRGAPPVGSNVITVSADDVKATGATSTFELLATVPQIASMFNGLPQNNPGTGGSLQIQRPNLRNLPAGNTATGGATLLLLDGHRLVNAGVGQAAPDANSVPPGAIERVEIVTDGGSSTYGSDAIGGVINYITRRKFDGIQADVRQGWAENYKTFDTTLTAGTNLGRGGIYFSYNYSKHDNLLGHDRSYSKSIDWTTGIPTGQSCNLANVAAGGTSYAVSIVSGNPVATPVVAPAVNNRCDPSLYQSLYPAESHHSVFAGLSQDFTDAVRFDLRTYYSTRTSDSSAGPYLSGNISIPANTTPAYTIPLPTTAARTVTFSLAPVLGNFSSTTTNKFEQWGITPTLTVDINDNWQLRSLLNYGQSKTSYNTPTLNTTLLSQYANSTAPATAINPYNIAATGSSPLWSQLGNYENAGEGRDKLSNARVIADGKLLSLPGGSVRLAAGAEYMKENFERRTIAAGSFDVVGAVDNLPWASYDRNVKSAFAELQIPIVGAGNAMRGLQSLQLSLAGRYDKYSDFGNTTNPKYGLSYKPVEWIVLRGNWGKSFNAPTPVDKLNSQSASLLALTQSTFNTLNPNPALPPTLPYFNQIGAPQQLLLFGADTNLKPQTSTNYSFGIDVSPPILPDWNAGVTYYHLAFRGYLGTPQFFFGGAFVQNFPAYVTFQNPNDPAGFLAQALAFAAKANQAIPATTLAMLTPAGISQVYELVDGRLQNIGNTNQSGVDFSVKYNHKTSFGSVDGSVSGNKQLTFYQQTSVGTPFFDNLLTNQPVFRMSASLGANIHQLRAQLIVNYSGGYNIVRTATLPQDHVSSFTTANLFFGYNLEGKGIWQDMALSLSVNNVLDQAPPVYRNLGGSNGAFGFTNGATVGRLLQLGINKKF
jgi:iron complex outermembrane recepter protein